MIRKITNVFLSGLLILCLYLIAFGLSTQQLLESDVYHQALDEAQVEQVFAEQYARSATALPARRVFDTVIDETLAYLRGDTQTVRTPEQVAYDSMREKLEALPECADPAQFDQDNLTCLPPGTTAQDVLSQTPRPATTQQPLQPVRDALALAQYVFVAAIVTAILCVLLLLYINRKHAREGMRWIESDLLFVGIGLVAIAFLLENQLPRMVAIGDETIMAFLLSVLSGVFALMKLYGSILIGTGLVILVLMLTTKGRKERENEPPGYENEKELKS